MAFSLCAIAITLSAGTNRNSACGSINLRISHGQATLSTFTFSRVIHFMFLPRRLLLGGICLIQRRTQSASELDGIVIRPEMHKEQPRFLFQHMAVQGCHVDAISAK